MKSAKVEEGTRYRINTKDIKRIHSKDWSYRAGAEREIGYFKARE